MKVIVKNALVIFVGLTLQGDVFLSVKRTFMITSVY